MSWKIPMTNLNFSIELPLLFSKNPTIVNKNILNTGECSSRSRFGGFETSWVILNIAASVWDQCSVVVSTGGCCCCCCCSTRWSSSLDFSVCCFTTVKLLLLFEETSVNKKTKAKMFEKHHFHPLIHKSVQCGPSTRRSGTQTDATVVRSVSTQTDSLPMSAKSLWLHSRRADRKTETRSSCDRCEIRRFGIFGAILGMFYGHSSGSHHSQTDNAIFTELGNIICMFVYAFATVWGFFSSFYFFVFLVPSM